VVLFGTNKLATVDPATLQLKEFALPNAETRPRRIAITPDDMVWYVDYARGALGRFDPKTGQAKEWAGPGGAASRPYAMTSDDKGRVWYFETNPQPNRLVGFDPKREVFFSVNEIASGGGTVRHMIFEKGKREIWFGSDAHTIGRAQVPN
jgi:virginiamycin B lyase